MASLDDWSKVGYNGNPVPGNPEVVDGIAREFRHIQDLAAEAARGLDAFLRKAENGGFEGQTADGLREYIRSALRTAFVPNVQHSFEQAAAAAERYANALREAQDRSESAARRGGAVVIPPAGVIAGDAQESWAEKLGIELGILDRTPVLPRELIAAKNDVRAEVDFINGEAKILEDALEEAARLVSKPVPKARTSGWQKFWKALEIIAIVVSILAIVFTGPLGLVALGLNAALFLKAVADYAAGKTDGRGLGLAALGLLFPSTRGLTTFGRMAGLFKAGGSLARRGLSRGLRAIPPTLSAGRNLLLQGGKLLLNPRAAAALTGQALTRWASSFGGLASRGLSRVPAFMARATRMMGGALQSLPGFFKGMWQQGRFALRRDFFMSTAFAGGGMGRRIGVYAIISTGRAFDFAVSALLPVRYAELAKFGYRTAFRMGFLERGLLMGPSVGRSMTRGAGSVGGGVFDLTRKGAPTPATGGPGGNVGKLVLPGTRAWDDALDELTEFVPPPTALPRTPAVSSLSPVSRSMAGRFPSSLDDLVEPSYFSDLDTAGSGFGTLLGKQSIDVLDLDHGGLLPPQLRSALDTLDTLDELGTPSLPGPRSVLLEQPQSAVTRLRNLDTVLGLDRTDAGLLKPLDDLEDLKGLADLGLDGGFGGLTVLQVRKILDGEVDLVNVTPDGVVLRIGKTDPVDVQVRLKDEVTVRVLGPSETVTELPSLMGKFTGPGSTAGPGIKLDDLVRLLPDAGGDIRRARQLLGMGPLQTDLVTRPVTAQTGFPPLTLREIITGGEVGKTATDRFQAWLRVQNAEIDLDTAGRELSRLTALPDVPPLSRARAELDLSAAELKVNQARMDFEGLGLNLDTVRQNVTVMMTRIDGQAANLPVGELRLLDDLGQPTGRWITLEGGETATWVVRSDAGIVPGIKVEMLADGFTLTGTGGAITRIGPDGRTLLDELPVRSASLPGPSAPQHVVGPVQAPVAPTVPVPSVPQVHWLVRQDMDFAAESLKSGMKTRLTDEGLVPVKADGTITPIQAVTTVNAKAFKENSPFTAFSPPGSLAKPYGTNEIGLDLAALSRDIRAGADSVKGVEIISNAQLQQNILDEIRLRVGNAQLDVPPHFNHLTGNKDLQNFLTVDHKITKGIATKVTPDIKALLQVRRDNTWLVKGVIPKEYLTSPYPTADSLKFVPDAPSTPLAAASDLLDSAGRASRSGLPPVELPNLTPRADDFFVNRFDLEELRGVRLVRQDNDPFHRILDVDKGLIKSHFDSDIGMIPANPEGATTAFQHVRGAENIKMKSDSPFTSFAEATNDAHKVYGNYEFTLDAYKLGADIKAGKLENVGILPARNLQQLIREQLDWTIRKQLDFGSLSADSSTQDVVKFLKENDAKVVGRGGKDMTIKVAYDVRVLLNTTRDQEWLVKGVIPQEYLKGPYPTTAASSGTGDALSAGTAGTLRGLDEAVGYIRLSDTVKADFDVKPALVEWRTPAGANSGSRPLELRIGELRLTDQLGRPSGHWITLEPGENLNWVVKTDAGTVVPGARVDMVDGGYRVTTPDGITTRFGPDGKPVLADTLPGLNRFDAPQPMSELHLMDPGRIAFRTEWQSAPRPGGGATLTDALGDVRLQYTADRALEFVDMRVPGRDVFLRFDAAPEIGSLPRVVDLDGVPLAGTGVVVAPVRGALGVVTGVRVGTPDGAWTARFDLDGTRLSEEVGLAGHTGGALTDARLITTVTRGPGGDMVPTLRVAAPGLGDDAFSVVRLPGGDATGRLPAGGFAVTDLANGDRFFFDRAGQFVDLPADAPPVRLDTAGTTVPNTNAGPLTALDDFGGPLSERFPLNSVPEHNLLDIPEHNLLDGAATDLPRIELPGAGAPTLARAADVALPTDLPLTRLTEFQDVPLSGVGDLAGLEFRIGAGSAADGVPGTFRLDVTQAGPTSHGAGPQPRFTVERLDSGAFRVTDPAGTTRWEFSARGDFLARETALVDNGLGLPSGLWFRTTATSMTDGVTSRIVGLVGPRGVTDSFPLTAIDRALQDRLPGGFTLTDSVTGSRFHYDADLNLAFRDVPDLDGSGFLRFTEGAPDVPPVRLDDLGGSSGPDDLARIFEHTLDEASGGMRPLSDPPLGVDLRLSGLDESTALRLSDAVQQHGDQWLARIGPADLPDLDHRAVWRILDEHWTGLLERTPGIRLSGADDLADLEIRVLRVPSTDTAPGSFRLELLDRAPAADGTVRGADFTVEQLPGGRFAITDPTGNRTWTFAQDGSFLGRETLLTGEGLPSGLRISATLNEDRVVLVDLLGPDSSVRSLRVTATEGALAGRLPGGFTLTDTITGSRFHFDRSGALVFRDLPARDGSGFLRFTEGARNAQPNRLVDALAERFPLSSIPEEDLLDDGLTDISELFEHTLDEASGIRAVTEGTAAADLSSISGAMEFLRVAPDSHLQNLDLLQVRQLAGDATDSLNRFPGLRPELLHDQLRHMTAQAHEGIRQGAATVMREYQSLPLATRLEDLRSGGSRVFGDFAVTPTPHGGPGGSRFTVTHTPTDLTTGFGPNRELLHQEVFLRGGPAELDGTRLGLTGRTAQGGWAPDSFEFVGTHVADDAFTVTRLGPNLPTDVRGGFTLTDAAGTTKWHYGPEGTLALRDVQLVGDRGVFRFEAGAPDGLPQVLDAAGNPALPLRAERLDDGRIALIHTGPGTQPLERAVFDASGGKLLEETVAIRGKGGRPTGSYWTIDHVTGKGVRVSGDNTPFTSRFDTGTLETSPTGQFKLTGKAPGKVALFEREVLKNGNTLHIARDRFGHARWTEFDDAGTRVRSGERIGDPDQRTYHDVPDGSWRLLNTSDVRTYHKALDGGLVRAEKGADGHWTWQRFDKNGVEALSGTRHWSANHVAFTDTLLDPATGLRTMAQRRGQTWPFDGLHGSRMYQEHSLLPGHAPAGTRVDPGTYVGQGPANAQIESLEALADGGSLLVKRFADQRPPAFMWKGAAGRNPFDGFFRDLFAGDSLNRVSHWTQTAADGTTVTGVRLNPSGSNWVDVDQFGRVVRENRKLDDGSVIEIGRSAEDPTRWAPLPEYHKGSPYELHWRNTTTGETGTRHADGLGQWRDVFTDGEGVQRVRLRSEGAGTREYLFDAPTPQDLARNDRAGIWVEKNSLQHVTGRRDRVGDVFVESSGSPYRTSWTWKTYDSADPATVLDEGVRKQNRGSLYSRTWDDSFVDLDRLGNVVRERNATAVGASWVDAVRQPDGTHTWTRTAADGTVHSEGVRVYDDVAKGRWRDLIDDQVVRSRDGGRVREYDYEIVTPQPPAAPAADLTRGTTLRDLLDRSARHFETPGTVRVDREVWKEYDLGKVFRERVKVDGDPVRYREVDKQWGQWREYQNGHLVEQRVFDGRVYKTDAFGRLSMSGPAVIPHYLGGVLPRVGGDVGLPGDRGWQLIGREFDYRGADIEAMGYLREVQDPWHGLFQGVRNGESVEMPMWQRELRGFLTSFSTGFVTDFTAGLLITELTNNGDLKVEDVFKAMLSGAVGGTFSGGLNTLYNHTRLGYLKTSMGARDWGGHPKQSMASNTDDWVTDWAAFEKPTRWRSATYANTVGLATGALSGFVSNAISASVFGVNGNEVQGVDALRAGLWGAAGSLFSGVSTGLARNAWHLSTGSRVFHKGGLGELGMNWVESALSKYIAFQIAQADSLNGNNLPSPGRAFPKPAATPAAPPPPRDPQRLADQPDAHFEGLELP
ncbi:hypothetical protein PV726_16295 [Streptomyces europaeiscabiei]|uniref:hypothetical protein n=1 Tax=Streptomyces europaeiscabiei TaxID=146819 RepID=UPI0029B1E913|nr:hypothetical protein [Streptomyces europaeiscabiei]MDX3691870.1 hypothetical protein [Streptomyces europaeiscabiei]